MLERCACILLCYTVQKVHQEYPTNLAIQEIISDRVKNTTSTVPIYGTPKMDKQIGNVTEVHLPKNLPEIFLVTVFLSPDTFLFGWTELCFDLTGLEIKTDYLNLGN